MRKLEALNRYSGHGHEYAWVDDKWEALPDHGFGCWTNSLNEVIAWARSHTAARFEIHIEAEITIPMIEKRLGETWLRNLLAPVESSEAPELADFEL